MPKMIVQSDAGGRARERMTNGQASMLSAHFHRGVALGYSFQIVQDWDAANLSCGIGLVLSEPAYDSIELALDRALSDNGWTSIARYGTFPIPIGKTRVLAEAIARLNPHRSVAWAHRELRSPSNRPYSLRDCVRLRGQVARFLLRSARNRKSVTILGI